MRLRRVVTIILPFLAVCSVAQAQLRPPSGGKGVGDYTLHDFAAKWMMQQDDIPELGKYRDANRALLAENDSRSRVVFIGDSITEIWRELETHSDADTRWINRGIGGSNTSQMLLRFEDDAIALAPATIVIMGGTNDLRAYVGAPASVVDGAVERVKRNITAMADIAQARGIRIILCAVPPVGRDLNRIARDPAGVTRINDWISTFARDRGLGLVDYGAVLADRDGYMKVEYSDDGIHPNSAGYQAMAPVLRTALARPSLKRFAHNGPMPSAEWFAAAQLKSPERAADGRVTWRYFDPEARAVKVVGDLGPLPLARGENGVWSYTAKVEPGVYAYGFDVDGVIVPDPANTAPKAGHWWPTAGKSMLRVDPGPAPASAEQRVAHVAYRSRALSADREFYVYTPPGYDVRRPKPYPVLYLLHGLTDDAGAWLSLGQAHTILDRQIESGAAEPMVVVMPTGYGVENLAALGVDPTRQKLNLAGFERELLEEVLPRIERGFNVGATRDTRAVAGLSMGGMEATYMGLRHPDLFAYVGAFSPAYQMLGLGMPESDYGAGFPATDAGKPPLRLFWMSNGDTDQIVGPYVTSFRAFLDQRRISYDFKPRAGGHIWSLWRTDLQEFVPLLFKAK